MNCQHAMRIQASIGLLTGLLTVATAGAQEPTVAAPSYNDAVRPILSNHCFSCHGPDAEHREAGLRLDVPDEADFDDVLWRISSDDPDVVMPPPDANKPLNDSQLKTLQAWIEAGAAYQRHWSFAPIASPELPDSRAVANWQVDADHPIDRLVVQRMESSPFQPAPLADRRALIRRLSLDLTGLPPTPEQVQQFLDDGSPTAYADLVDRLLASPRFGEHLGRYWLDLVRFADTNGLHHDHYRDMTPYRDWVIRAFNDNLPYDQFLTDQLAGDLVDDPSIDQQIASGFNRLHLIIDRGTALPEESFHRNVVDRVTAFGTAFMGLTVQCAECHDHKYDPLTQREFYQLYAFFNNFDGGPETGGRSGTDFYRGLQPPYIDLPGPHQRERLQKFDRELAELNQQIAALDAAAKQADSKTEQKTEEESDSGTDRESADSDTDPTDREALVERRKQLQAQRDELQKQVRGAMVMKERPEPRETRIRIRGVYDQLGDVVDRDTPSFLPPLVKADTSATPDRLDLARWLTSPQHPLAARVAVNRFWQQLFGIGLVKTAADFGAQGESPRHARLLDLLASRFIDSGWDVKALMRFMVMSKIYQQSSTAAPEAFREDPKNRWLARGSRYRLDAEVIRDQILLLTGRLNLEMYGKSVKPPQPEGLWETVAMPSSYPRTYVIDEGDDRYRRSVYTFWKRALPPPQMTIFDAPTREACIARRERTNTPLQALVLMNESEYFASAIFLARQLSFDTDSSREQQLASLYERITGRIPNTATRKSMLEGWNTFYQSFAADPESVKTMLSTYGGQGIDQLPEELAPEVAATGMLVHSLLNLDTTRQRD